MTATLAIASPARQLDTSLIEWTGPTWNPWQACHMISPGCANCYMFTGMRRWGKDPDKPFRSSPATFNKPLKWQREVEAGDRTVRDRLVFTCSWSDWFIEEADPWRNDAWDIVRRCPSLVFQILTKRPERIAGRLPHDWHDIQHHVWMGVTVESSKQAYRIKALNDALNGWANSQGCGIRFVSYEPALSAIEWCKVEGIEHINWIIAGGESGPKARAPLADWFRQTRDFCHSLRTPFFFKQWGEYLPLEHTCEQPTRVGKKAAGRHLDGQLHDDMPTLPA